MSPPAPMPLTICPCAPMNAAVEPSSVRRDVEHGVEVDSVHVHERRQLRVPLRRERFSAPRDVRVHEVRGAEAEAVRPAEVQLRLRALPRFLRPRAFELVRDLRERLVPMSDLQTRPPDPPCRKRRTRAVGPAHDKISYASFSLLNDLDAASRDAGEKCLSGWATCASARYARLMSSALASRDTFRFAYRSRSLDANGFASSPGSSPTSSTSSPSMTRGALGCGGSTSTSENYEPMHPV